MNSLKPKEILILGSTGSIGCSTVELLKSHKHLYRAKTLVAGSNVKKLAEQAIMLKPENIVLADEKEYKSLLEILSPYPEINIFAGKQAVLDLAKAEYDVSISAITGISGLEPTISAIPNSKVLGLANKESLICAGRLMLDLAKENNTSIIPVDSEHNAIFQLLEYNNNRNNISNIALTASGGPFWNFSLEEMSNVTPEQALKHPKWNMGSKISIDSATMMNKGIEVIEAAYLFDIDLDKIQVLVHPEALVHGMVYYRDGSTKMYCSKNDMKIPISYALSYPNRASLDVAMINFADITNLSFYNPDDKRFPLLNIAINAAKLGQSAIIVLNAANEIAINLFLANKIKFLDIAKIVEYSLDKFTRPTISCIEDIIKLHMMVTDNLRIQYHFDK